MDKTIDSFLKNKTKEIEKLLNKWGFPEGSIKRDSVRIQIKSWLNNDEFRRSSPNNIYIYEDAFLLLDLIEYLENDLDGYIHDLTEGLKSYMNQHKIDLNQIVVFPLGSSTADGGNNFIPGIKRNLGIEKTNAPLATFLDYNFTNKNVQSVVFIDDFIGTGNTIIEFIESNKEKILNLKKEKNSLKIIILSAVGFEKARLELQKNIELIDYIQFAHELFEEDKVFSANSRFFLKEPVRTRIENWCKKIGTDLYEPGPLGYGDSQSLIVFKDNYVPNNTLPIIWAGPESECTSPLSKKWKPLFPRKKKKETKKPTEPNIVELTDTKSLVESPLTITNLSDEDFKILNIEKYKYKFEILTGSTENSTYFKSFIYESSVYRNLIQDIKDNLNNKGISFIIAPIQFGKSFLLKHIQNEFSEYNYISEINGNSLKKKDYKPQKLKELYFFWYKEICTGIMVSNGTHKSTLADETNERLDHFDKFYHALESNRSSCGSEIKGLIQCLSEFKTELEFKKDVLVSFHLDDIQSYLAENTFRLLIKDLEFFKKDSVNESKKSVKLLVASRYFPTSGYKNIGVNVLPYYNEDTIMNLTNFLEDEIGKGIKKDFSNLILNRTDGYPWFVFRFFKVYLKERLNDNKIHPLLLAKSIFDNKFFWTQDLFKNNNDSEFLDALKLLIDDSDPNMKRKFKEFIQLKPEPTILLNGYNNGNNFLLSQSGFLKKDNATDIFVNNGCYIMKEHYQSIIESILS